jgi:hypothetical protein
MKLQVGDRVRLTKAVASNMSVRQAKQSKVNWSKREGTIVSQQQYTKLWHVLWDGRRSSEGWPAIALEKTPAGEAGD